MPVLWASGQAGWFELIPSTTYAPIANSIFQAVTLYYNVDDQYKAELAALKRVEKAKPRPARRNLSVQDVKVPIKDVLFQYAVATGDGVTQEESLQRCHDYAGFLLVQFSKERAPHPFHEWLSSEYSVRSRPISFSPSQS